MKYNEITDPKIVEVLDAFRTYLGSYDEETKSYYKDTNDWVNYEYWDCAIKSDYVVESYETIRTIVLDIVDGDEGGPNVVIANFDQDYNDEWVLRQATHIFDTMWAEFAHHSLDKNSLEIYNINTEKFE